MPRSCTTLDVGYVVITGSFNFTKSADIDAGVNFAISIKLLKTSIAEQIKAGKVF